MKKRQISFNNIHKIEQIAIQEEAQERVNGSVDFDNSEDKFIARIRSKETQKAVPQSFRA